MEGRMRLFAHVCTCGQDGTTREREMVGVGGVGVGGGSEPAEVTDWKITVGIRKGSVKM